MTLEVLSFIIRTKASGKIKTWTVSRTRYHPSVICKSFTYLFGLNFSSEKRSPGVVRSPSLPTKSM